MIKEFEKVISENNPTLLAMIPVCAKPAEVERMLHVKENYLVLLWTPSWEEQEPDEKLVLLLPKELIEFDQSLEVEELWKSIEKWKD